MITTFQRLQKRWKSLKFFKIPHYKAQYLKVLELILTKIAGLHRQWETKLLPEWLPGSKHSVSWARGDGLMSPSQSPQILEVGPPNSSVSTSSPSPGDKDNVWFDVPQHHPEENNVRKTWENYKNRAQRNNKVENIRDAFWHRGQNDKESNI